MRNYFLYLILSIIFISCSKGIESKGRESSPPPIPIPTPTTTDVYIAGDTVTPSGKIVAVYWKNGVPISLTDGSKEESLATSIFVSGRDVYVAGVKDSSGIGVATYWKNGSPIHLTASSFSSTATSI